MSERFLKNAGLLKKLGALAKEWTADPYTLPFAEARRRAVLTFDARYLEEMLSRAGGNVSEAARLAGMDRANFGRQVRLVRDQLRRRVERRK